MPIRAQRSTLPSQLHLLEKPQLVAGTDEVVLGIEGFVVGVAVQVVGEETDGLHHREQRDRVPDKKFFLSTVVI